ncbi:hypothetical protein D3C83_134470 [compost metagenome]
MASDLLEQGFFKRRLALGGAAFQQESPARERNEHHGADNAPTMIHGTSPLGLAVADCTAPP